jgi:hypothetical protein
VPVVSDARKTEPLSTRTPTLAVQYGIDPTSISVTNGWTLSRPLSGKSATVYGLEISYLQHLTFLPGALSGIGLSANYRYTHSSTTGVPLRTDTPAQQRQAPNSWNFSPDLRSLARIRAAGGFSQRREHLQLQLSEP